MREHAHLLIDGQAHLYPRFDLNVFLSSALANFTRAAKDLALDTPLGVLMITDMPRAEGFARLTGVLKGAETSTVSTHWQLKRIAEEPGSLLFEHRDGATMIGIAGRQVNTAERIEVLSIGSAAPVADAMSLTQTISTVRAKGGIPLLPWGVGKWLGARHRLILKTLDEFPPEHLMFGDNGLRPRLWPRSSILGKATSLGYKVVSGTDSLPCPHEVKRPGSFGCWLKASIDMTAPGRQVRALLLDRDAELKAYGKPAHTWRFALDQTMIRLKRYD